MRYRKILLFCAVVCCSAGCAPKYEIPDYLNTLKKASTAETKDPATAEQLLKTALLQAGIELQARFHVQSAMGKFYIRQKRYAEAEQCIKKAIEFRRREVQQDAEEKEAMKLKVPAASNDTKSSPADEEKSRELQKQQSEALTATDKLQPGDYPEPINDLALVYDLQGRHKEADALWKQALHEWPDREISLEREADESNLARSPKKAVELYKRAIFMRKNVSKTGRRLACLYDYIGNIYGELKKNDEAESSFKTSMELFKTVPVTDYLSAWERRSTMENYVTFLKKQNRQADADVFSADIADLKAREEKYQHN